MPGKAPASFDSVRPTTPDSAQDASAGVFTPDSAQDASAGVFSTHATAAYSLDVALFEAQLHPDPALPLEARAAQLEAASALYTGDFLAGFFVRDAPAFEEWMLAQRARYRELALNALHALTQLHLDLGRYDLAIRDATRLLALDEWREESHGQLMLALARTGQRSAALAQYKRCCRLLRQEFGVEPSAGSTALYERIRVAMSGPRHNLPAATTGFVGREREIAELRRLLLPRAGPAAPENRLVTILGPGGAGKTRLALEVAAACEPMFLNGAWFVPLAAACPAMPGREAAERLAVDRPAGTGLPARPVYTAAGRRRAWKPRPRWTRSPRSPSQNFESTFRTMRRSPLKPVPCPAMGRARFRERGGSWNEPDPAAR